MLFQDFQREQEILDRVAKQTIGPNVKVKDPVTFKSFLEKSYDVFKNIKPPKYISGGGLLSPPSIPTPESDIPFFGEGGVVNPDRLREQALATFGGIGETLSPYSGTEIELGGVEGRPEAIIDQTIDRNLAGQYGAQFGPEIPEWVPLVGGMTPLEAGLGGAAYMSTPADIGITLGTAGLGPAVSAGFRGMQIGARGLPGAKAAATRGVGRVGELLTTPVATGGLPTRIAAETAIQAPTASLIAGTDKRKQEGTAYPWENTLTALAAGVVGTGVGLAGIGRAMTPVDAGKRVNWEIIDNPKKSVVTPELDYSFIGNNMKDMVTKSLADRRYRKTFTTPDIEPFEIKRKPFGVRYDENGKIIAVGKVTGGSGKFTDDDLVEFLQNNSNKLIKSNDLGDMFPNMFDDPEVAAKLKFLTRSQKKHIIDYIFGSVDPQTGKTRRGKIFQASDKNRKYTVANGYPNGKDWLKENEQRYIIDLLITKQAGKKFDPALQSELAKNPQLKDALYEVFNKMPVILRRMRYGQNIPFSTKQKSILEKLVKVLDTSDKQNNITLNINEVRVKDAKTRGFIETRSKNLEEGQNPFDANYNANKTVRESFDEATRKLNKEAKRTGPRYQGFAIDDNIKTLKNSIIFNANRAGVSPIYRGKITGTNGFVTLTADEITSQRGDYGKTLYQAIFDNNDVNEINTLITTRIANQVDQNTAFIALVKLLGGTQYKVGTKPQNIKFGMQGKLPNARERALLEKALGKDIYKALSKLRSKKERALDAFSQIWNVPRTMMATAEVSALARQGGYYMFARPLSWAKSIPPALKEAKRAMLINKFDPYVQRIELEKYAEDPDFEYAKQTGLEITDSLSTSLVDREEQFIPTFLDKLPDYSVIGPIIRASAAFHSGFLNNLRFNVFKSMMKNISPDGTAETFVREARKISPQEGDRAVKTLEGLNKIINAATGRGPKIFDDEVVAILNQLFFSYRMQTARAYLPIAPFVEYPQMVWSARKQLIGDHVRFYGMVTTLGFLIPFLYEKATGDETATYDWIKGKLRIAKTTYDIAAGNNKYTGIVLNSLGLFLDEKTLKPRGIGTGKPYDIHPKKLLMGGIRGALHPTAGMIYGGIQGTDFLGNELDYEIYNPVETSKFGKTARDYLTPLIYSGLMESIELYDNPIAPRIGFAAEFIGVGNSSYEDKQSVAKELFGKRYTELLPFQQKIVTAAYYADDNVNRDVPNTTSADLDYFKLLNDITVNMRNGNLSPKDAVYQYKQGRKDFGVIRRDRGKIEYGWDDSDNDDGMDYYGGTPAELQALSQHWSTFDQDIYLPSADAGKSTIVDWDKYDEIKDSYNWTEEQERYVAANSNIMDFHMPEDLLLAIKKHDRNLAEKIITSWEARDYYMELIEKESPINWKEELDFSIGSIIEKNKK